MSSTTPIAFTRGLQPEGQWAKDQKVSVYGNEGGHIVFLEGNVSFYKDLSDKEGGTDRGRLEGLNKKRTSNILKTIDSSARIFSNPATGTGAIDGMPGLGERDSPTK